MLMSLAPLQPEILGMQPTAQKVNQEGVFLIIGLWMLKPAICLLYEKHNPIASGILSSSADNKSF